MHNGHITFNKEKMSKSLGNIVTVRSVLEKYSGAVVRLALLSAHYRQPLDWTEALLTQSHSILSRFYNVFNVCDDQSFEAPEAFLSALTDDLNIPKALTLMHDYANLFFKTQDHQYAKNLVACLRFLDLLPEKKTLMFSEEEIYFWVNKRQEAKKQKDYQEADRIRLMLKDKGVTLEDTQQGVRVHKMTDV